MEKIAGVIDAGTASTGALPLGFPFVGFCRYGTIPAMNSVSEQLRLSDFDYELPADRIAQTPAPLRDRSKLMVLDRMDGAVRHGIFADIENLLLPGDVLVLNDTRVFPCRL